MMQRFVVIDARSQSLATPHALNVRRGDVIVWVCNSPGTWTMSGFPKNLFGETDPTYSVVEGGIQSSSLVASDASGPYSYTITELKTNKRWDPVIIVDPGGGPDGGKK